MVKVKETVFGILPRLFGLEARVHLVERQTEEQRMAAKTLQEVKDVVDRMNKEVQSNTTAITALGTQVGDIAKRMGDAIETLRASATGEPEYDTLVNSITQATSTLSENNGQLARISTEIQARSNSLEPNIQPSGQAVPIATDPVTVNVGTGIELASGQPNVVQPPRPA